MRIKIPINIILVLLALVAVVGWILWFTATKNRSNTISNTPINSSTQAEPTPELVTGEIQMTTGNFFFSKKSLRVKKGQPVKIVVSNVGTHTFTIDKLGVNVPLNGFSKTIEFTPNKSGTFQYYCTVPGHKEAGMVGTLTVQ